MWKQRRGDGLQLIGVNLGEPVDRVKSYVAQLGLTLPVVIDAGGEVAGAYGVRFTPTHFLVDRAGIVRAAGAGARDWQSPAARAAIDVLVKGRSSSIPRTERR